MFLTLILVFCKEPHESMSCCVDWYHVLLQRRMILCSLKDQESLETLVYWTYIWGMGLIPLSLVHVQAFEYYIM